MTDGYRQEVFNVLLAQLLEERGIVSAPEAVLKITPEKLRRLPDVIVDFNGLRTVIEGEVDDQPDARMRALLSARRRVEEGIAHIAIAIVYPAHLRKEEFHELKGALSMSELDMAIITESEDSGFIKGGIDLLEGALRRAFDKLIEEDVVAQAVSVLEAGIEKFAGMVIGKEGVLKRTAQILGIRELPQKESSEESE